MRFENNPFSIWTPKTETFENAAPSFVEGLFITMAFKLAIGTFSTASNKGIVLKNGLRTPFCWSNVNGYRFHGVFIWKRSNGANAVRWHCSVFKWRNDVHANSPIVLFSASKLYYSNGAKFDKRKRRGSQGRKPPIVGEIFENQLQLDKNLPLVRQKVGE